jgi:hypothetical protein
MGVRNLIASIFQGGTKKFSSLFHFQVRMVKSPTAVSRSAGSTRIELSEIPQQRPERQYARDDFEFGSLLGIGALAQVVHVRDTYTGEEYALKILDKKQLRRVRIYSELHIHVSVWQSFANNKRERNAIKDGASRDCEIILHFPRFHVALLGPGTLSEWRVGGAHRA